MRINYHAIALAALLAIQSGAAPAADPAPVRHLEGSIASGARYTFDVPPNWNGTLLLFSRGYSAGPAAGPVRNVARDEKDLLLARGFALAGSGFSKAGWALEEAVPDQVATLDAFAAQVGKPARTIAWGTSMGGLITIALLERHPQRFDAGLALCASAAGTVGMMNAALDGAFAFKTLLAPDSALPLLFKGPKGEGKQQLAQWQQQLDAAQATPAGRARLALAATLGQVPTWIEPGSAQPAADDIAAQQHQLYRGFVGAVLLPRDDQLARAGGNFSWNTGIDYTAQLEKSGRAAFVRALYAQAGLDLDADLKRLAQAPRIAAEPGAVGYMKRHYAPTGKLAKPVLLVQTVSDPVTLAEFSGEYARLARAAGAGELVREAYVQRVGHCNFKPGETVAALMTLQQRLESGSWNAGGKDASSAPSLNALAASTAPEGGDYTGFRPAPFLRACSGAEARCAGEPGNQSR
ncbi:serine aminopeptidase domain-containing protein [Massilia niastensis]|uniref:serine aminopeptidase domain-containing protein n=1 Tax=Massilia niastensis TaxID=544911 RepID=UPI00037D5FBB|nr:alpha/beta hydrolase [Massilia niastensis]